MSIEFPRFLDITEYSTNAMLFTLKNHTGTSAEALYLEVMGTSILPWQRRVTTISQYLPAKIQKSFG
jgi:hypothetical protein